MKKIIFLLLFNCFFCQIPFAQTIPSLQKKLDSVFKSFNSRTSPGVAITILQNGKLIAKKTYGMASLEHKIPFTHNTVLRLPYSEGREFISIAAVMMEQQGLLKLDDKIRKYFPKLPQWSEPVTLWNLLNHSSGFEDEWAALLLTHGSMSNRFDVSQFLNFLYTQPAPVIEPGKGYMYSNSDFGLLRMILEKASGENLQTWMKNKLFDPLSMKSTLLHDDKNEVIPGFAMEYQQADRENFAPGQVIKLLPEEIITLLQVPMTCSTGLQHMLTKIQTLQKPLPAY